MTTEAQIFFTTDKAGRRVAGRPIPLDDSGAPKVGTELSLTAVEAEYELLLGTISADKPAPVPEVASAPIAEDKQAKKAGKSDAASIEAASSGA